MHGAKAAAVQTAFLRGEFAIMTERTSKRSRFAGLLLGGAATGAIAALLAAPAAAQTAAPARPAAGLEAASTQAAGGVPELVVTAERREVNLQQAAIAATVLTGEDLKRRGIDNIDMLQFTTPSLSIVDTGTGALVNIRGIGKSDQGQEVAPGTLIYRDGVSVTPGGILSDEPYYDISNVEVLRGPQGTFAGENATGGAIFITETDPELGRFGGWVEGQDGNYSDARLQGAVNIPIGDTFALRIATDDERRDSFFHLTGPFTGSDGRLFLGAGRVSALWEPTKAFKAELKLDYMDEDMSHPSGVFNGNTANLFNVTQAGHLLGIERQFRSVLQLSYEFDDGITIKSISGYQIGQVAATIDANGAASSASEITFHSNSQDKTVSEEIDVISPSTGRFQWVVGGVYQNDVVSQPNGSNWLSLTPGSTPASIPTPSSCPIFFATGGAVPCETVLLDQYTATKDSAGVFGQVSFDITPTLKLNVGARYSSLSFRLDSLDELLVFSTPTLGQRIVGDTEKDSKVTGKVDLTWNVDPNNMLYAFVATGHKGGGVNGLGALQLIIPGVPIPPATPAQLPTQFGPEDVTDYEIGWKANAFDNHLHTQLGAFYNDYTGFQVAFFSPALAAGIDVNAPGHTIIDGVEAQAQAQWGGWSADFGASYLHSSLGNISAIDSRNPLTLGPGGLPVPIVVNLAGRQQTYAPTWTVQVGVQYTFNLPGDATLTPRLDYGYVGSQWATLFEDRALGDFLAPRSLFNGQIIYQRPDNWRVTLYATNLFDERYVAAQVLDNLGVPGPPRQFGVRVAKSF
jgi:iron complex outermembrane receptor protein